MVKWYINILHYYYYYIWETASRDLPMEMINMVLNRECCPIMVLQNYWTLEGGVGQEWSSFRRTRGLSFWTVSQKKLMQLKESKNTCYKIKVRYLCYNWFGVPHNNVEACTASVPTPQYNKNMVVFVARRGDIVRASWYGGTIQSI